MRNICLHNATTNDAAFALRVVEACMRPHAEQTWGTWNGLADRLLYFGKSDQRKKVAGDKRYFSFSADRPLVTKQHGSRLPAENARTELSRQQPFNRGRLGCLHDRL